MNALAFLISPFAALALSPLLAGIINRTKALVAGRQGRRSFCRHTTIFSASFARAPCTAVPHRGSSGSPLWSIFSATLGATCFVPFLPPAPAGLLRGDVVVLLYLLGLARFFLILSALDTGSAFEGMGASREAFFSALAEPVMFVCLLNVMRANGAGSSEAPLSAAHRIRFHYRAAYGTASLHHPLAENARIPFDDPNTHLELTMIHEVMILDNSGPGLALLEYAASDQTVAVFAGPGEDTAPRARVSLCRRSSFSA